MIIFNFQKIKIIYTDFSFCFVLAAEDNTKQWALGRRKLTGWVSRALFCWYLWKEVPLFATYKRRDLGWGGLRFGLKWLTDFTGNLCRAWYGWRLSQPGCSALQS